MQAQPQAVECPSVPPVETKSVPSLSQWPYKLYMDFSYDPDLNVQGLVLSGLWISSKAPCITCIK